MKFQIKAFQISFLLHGLIIATAILLSILIPPSNKVMILDFSLKKASPKVHKAPPPPPEPVIKKKRVEPHPQIVRRKEAPKPLEEKPKILEEKPKLLEEKPKQLPSPTLPPVLKLPEAQNLGIGPIGIGLPESSKSIKEGSPGIPGGSGGSNEGTGIGSDGNNGGIGKETAKKNYLREHFVYIRDKVLRNISYPETARRMGWQGQVILAFIITSEGSVRDLKIIRGSGFPILDKTAVETVKETAPFPKPPVEAQIIIPILFKID